MAFYITAHYPHPEPDTHPWHIYLRDEFEHLAKRVRVGDKVLFYESKHHKPMKDGKKRRRGQEAVVRLGTVSDSAKVRPPTKAVAEYADGTTANWKWGIATDPETLETGFLSRVQFNKEMGYQPKNYLRGFGDEHSGLKEIDEDTFYRLVKLFRAGKR